ncbi:MAG: ABC transporter permease subunit [Chloroflexota bacterium]
MNIYKQEFKMHFRSVMIWSVSIAALLWVYLSAFSVIGAETDLLNEMMSSFPPELLVAFGMENMDWSTVLGFFPVVFLFAQVCLAIQASNYGFSLVSIEERELTADFLLAKPISRTKILTSKLLAAITSLTITNIVVWIASFVVIEMVSDGAEYDTGALIMVLATIVVFQLFFLSFGMLISLLVKRVRAVTPYSMALAFGMYVLSAFGGMLGDASLEIISPFKHFDPHYILAHLEYDIPLVMISVTVIILSILGSYLLYARRNIASAV